MDYLPEGVPRPQELRVPISPTVRVYIIFDGTPTTAAEFACLHEAINSAERALLGAAPPVTPLLQYEAPEAKPKRSWKLKKLPPCIHHPESPRHKNTNRCIACMQERAEAMREGKKQKPVVEEDEYETITPEPVPANEQEQSAQTYKLFEFSVRIRCPKCGAGLVRLRRIRGGVNGYWIHVDAGCQIKVAAYLSSIRVDEHYHPTEQDLRNVSAAAKVTST